MKIRVKNKWNDKNRERTPEETGSVLSFNFWKIASANVMHMENEGFQTDTHFQRLDVIAEFTAFLVHVVDRVISSKQYSAEDRQALITGLALNLAKTMHDNRRDVSDDKETDFRSEYISLMNEFPAIQLQVLTLCSASEWFTERLTRYPILLDSLLSTAARSPLVSYRSQRLSGES